MNTKPMGEHDHSRERAESVVRRFLLALEARDVEAAQALLAPDAAITFPGGAVRRSVGDIVAGSARKYRHVGKSIEQVDVMDPAGGRTIVYCFGRLHGRWADGGAFEGIRFIDRFEVADGLIERHDVWNDAAYARPPLPPS